MTKPVLIEVKRIEVGLTGLTTRGHVTDLSLLTIRPATRIAGPSVRWSVFCSTWSSSNSWAAAKVPRRPRTTTPRSPSGAKNGEHEERDGEEPTERMEPTEVQAMNLWTGHAEHVRAPNFACSPWSKGLACFRTLLATSL